ncbi:Uncharacterised protein [Escherichia coli]|nr:Uncharacterised protein [Escherichia coli]
MLQAQLRPAGILDRLVDEHQAVGKRPQARVGGGPGVLVFGPQRREGGDQPGVEAVVLGPAQMHLGERLDLQGLVQADLQAAGAQGIGDAALVAA